MKIKKPVHAASWRENIRRQSNTPASGSGSPVQNFGRQGNTLKLFCRRNFPSWVSWYYRFDLCRRMLSSSPSQQHLLLVVQKKAPRKNEGRNNLQCNITMLVALVVFVVQANSTLYFPTHKHE